MFLAVDTTPYLVFETEIGNPKSEFEIQIGGGVLSLLTELVIQSLIALTACGVKGQAIVTCILPCTSS